jgi:hypothetical protein
MVLLHKIGVTIKNNIWFIANDSMANCNTNFCKRKDGKSCLMVSDTVFFLNIE